MNSGTKIPNIKMQLKKAYFAIPKMYMIHLQCNYCWMHIKNTEWSPKFKLTRLMWGTYHQSPFVHLLYAITYWNQTELGINKQRISKRSTESALNDVKYEVQKVDYRVTVVNKNIKIDNKLTQDYNSPQI